MAPPSPLLDHIVIDVRDRIDEALQRFTDLGFHLTARGHHTLGSSNHLAVFATDYLELLGFDAGGAARPEIASFPIGLNGLVFKADDADGIYRHARGAGLPIQPVESFSRPVRLAGTTQDARFRTTRLDPKEVAMGRVYFCEHLTPELVWRPEWQVHPNGARAIARVVVATPDPRRTAALFHRLFGPVAAVHGDRLTLAAGAARVELALPAAVAEEFGDAAADPAGRSEYLAAAVFKVTSLRETARQLGSATGLLVEERRVLVPAAAAFNTTLVFAE